MHRRHPNHRRSRTNNDNGQPDPDVYTDTFVWDYFPPRFRPSYDPDFFAKVLVTTIKVTQDLASPSADRPACIAEEIIVRAICRYAYALMDEADLDYDAVLEDLLLEDADFELLFSKDMDGVENDPAMQRSLGMWIPPVEGWFTPFNDTRVVHPYVEATTITAQVHDLHLLTPPNCRRHRNPCDRRPRTDHRTATNQRSSRLGP